MTVNIVYADLSESERMIWDSAFDTGHMAGYREGRRSGWECGVSGLPL